MKVKFYLLPFLIFLFNQRLGAQNCSSLSLSYATTESRCVATGSILVNASGGSGNYSYKASGPITTPTTSSNVITGLPAGYYTLFVKDLSSNCIKQVDSVHVSGSYQDPRFQLTKTDAGCAGNDGSVSVMNQQFGRSPFRFTIISPSPSHIGATNTTGSFTGLTPGEYVIQLQDSCGGIQVRRITIENYNWWFDSVSVNRLGCDSAIAFIRLKDNKGNVNTSGTTYTGFSYGYIRGPGDTVWTSSKSFHLYIGTHRNVTLVARDNCGTIHTYNWFLPANLMPAVASVSIANVGCTQFNATVTGQWNLTSPQYCIYNQANVLLNCNTTGVFTGLAFGSYCIKITDPCYDTVITRCFTASKPLPAVAANVTISNQNCTGFNATITGQQNLNSPSYCLYTPGHVLITCNSSGVFNNVAYGSYCIETHDVCTDTIIQRCFTATRPVAVLTSYNISGSSCSGFNVSVGGNNLISPYYCLYDSAGNVVSCDSTGVFNGINHGHYCIKAISCGDTTNSLCFTTSRPIPAVGGIGTSDKNCTSFTAYVYGQVNLTNPQYCIYDQGNHQLSCNATGVFTNLPFGDYCIKIVNTCYDTTITKCFSVHPDVPLINGTLQLLSSNCTVVSFKASGTNLTNPQYCLYNASSVLVECNSTGLFSNEPYGSYCVQIANGCGDTSFRVCQTFSPVHGLSLSTTKSCTIGSSYVDVLFATGNAPYQVWVYHPSGALVFSAATSSNPYRIQLSALPAGTQYKVVGADNCGNLDSAFISPDANIVTKSTTVRTKCPSAAWLNGAGDILANSASNYYAVVPQIIKKNGLAFTLSYSSVSGTVYTFSDLEPAQYIIEYTQQVCTGKLYDTVTVQPYQYPTQGQSAIYQCDNNSFSLGADVHGGVSPYSFQIIGSMPDNPSIATQPQSLSVFTINTGTTYSLVRLRTIDACGNATLSDVSVLPLQNLSITANTTCFFQNVTLSVDTIPNAQYFWYKRNAPGDSTLLGTGLNYNFPFFTPAEMGQYVCKVVLNSGCITRLSSFTLDGNCGQVFLPLSFTLNGRRTGSANQLYWTNSNEQGVLKYVIERKQAGDNNFYAIGNLLPHSNDYVFNDLSPTSGNNTYRLRVVYAAKTEITNLVNLKLDSKPVTVYPNPVNDVLHINLPGEVQARYLVEIVSSSGQVIYKNAVKTNGPSVINYTRERSTPKGVYLLRVSNLDSGNADVFRLLFE